MTACHELVFTTFRNNTPGFRGSISVKSPKFDPLLPGYYFEIYCVHGLDDRSSMIIDHHHRIEDGPTEEENDGYFT